MDESKTDAGTIQVLLDRLNHFRLPRALALKKKVDEGGTLDDSDIKFLERVLADTSSVTGIADRHPELQSLIAKLAGLYNEITRKALENEEKARR
jgi:hypothetical protein